MKKVSRKEVKEKVSAAMDQALHTIEVLKPSRKTKKLLKKVTKNLTAEIKANLKKGQAKMKSAKKKLGKKAKEVLNRHSDTLVAAGQ